MAKRMGDVNSWVRTFEVTEPTRHRKGFTVYKVTSVVFPKSFPESATKITVWKRYSDFRKLHRDLEQIFKQLYLRGEFPVFPKAKLFGRFEHEVIEERRKAALVLLEFTANFTQLFTSTPFLRFFENGFSAQDFLGKVLFGQGGAGFDPPCEVHQETSEIPTPCLKPEILWRPSEAPANEADGVSLSPSSMSSSMSPSECGELPAPLVPEQTSTEPVPNPKTAMIKIHRLDDPVTSNGESSQNSGNPNVVLANAEKQVHRANGIVRSATVTDELSSFYDDEFEDSAFLFPTGSCSSLDTLPGFTAASEEAASSSNSKSNPSTSRSIFTLPRRKPSGFGFFDFLPLFPKKSGKQEPAKEKEATLPPAEMEKTRVTKTASLSVGYICEAAGHFAVAQFHESNADYQNAFNSYKEGINVLLEGAQVDTDRERKVLAKNKLLKYLKKAETVKDQFNLSVPSGNGTISPVFSSPSKRKSVTALAGDDNSMNDQGGENCLCSIEDLKPYKVVGLGPRRSKILIVMNPEESSPKCHAIKVLWKSPCQMYQDKPTIIPWQIPFMVKLVKWFNTQDKIILLLEHAGGGRLEDFVRNYQTKLLSLSTPTEEVSEQALQTTEEYLTIDNNEDDIREHPDNTQDAPSSYDYESIEPSTDKNAESNQETEVFSTPAPTPPLMDDDTPPDVSTLLKNSKALIDTVSRTLEDQSSPRKEYLGGGDAISSDSGVKPNESAPVVVNDDQTGEKATIKNFFRSRSESCEDDESLEDVLPKRMVPEGVVRVWLGEIVLALEALHLVGITYGDLQLKDVLLGENGHILLRYKSLWSDVDEPFAWNNQYIAPEVRASHGTPSWKVHSSADWWSLGGIAYLLLTGQSFQVAHPEGIYPEMLLKVPNMTVCDTPISKGAQSLLKELLQYASELRLGFYGAVEIKTHPFFDGLEWDKMAEGGTSEQPQLSIS